MSEIRRYRKRPVVVEAIQYRPDIPNCAEVAAFLDDGGDHACKEPHDGIGVWPIRTLEGWVMASSGDWIIKGVAGEFYPCKPDVFEQTYEEVT